MLTPKKRRFASEYLLDSCATQAAIRAGYSQKSAYSQGQRLLKNVEVAEIIRTLQVSLQEQTAISKDVVLKALASVALGDIGSFIKTTRDGSFEVEIPDDLSALAELSVTTTPRGKKTKIRMADKTKALRLLGKSLGMFK